MKVNFEINNIVSRVVIRTQRHCLRSIVNITRKTNLQLDDFGTDVLKRHSSRCIFITVRTEQSSDDDAGIELPVQCHVNLVNHVRSDDFRSKNYKLSATAYRALIIISIGSFTTPLKISYYMPAKMSESQ